MQDTVKTPNMQRLLIFATRMYEMICPSSFSEQKCSIPQYLSHDEKINSTLREPHYCEDSIQLIIIVWC